MKAVLMIISLIAALFLSQGKKLVQEECKRTSYSAAQIDSILEAGRIDRMESKFN